MFLKLNILLRAITSRISYDLFLSESNICKEEFAGLRGSRNEIMQLLFFSSSSI